MNLAKMLAAMESARENGEPSRPRPLPSAQIMSLREAFAQYGANPFKPGDITTPRRNAPNRFAGQPHLVIEVREAPAPDFTNGEVGSNSHGQRNNLRVAVMTDDGKVATYWDESWCHVPYEASP